METGWHASSYFRSYPLHSSGMKRPVICPLLRQGYYVEMGKELFGEDNTSFQILIV